MADSIAGIAIHIDNVAPIIQRRTVHVGYETSPTVSMGIVRGRRGVHVTANVRSEASWTSLRSLWADGSSTTAALVAAKRTRYSGTYIMGDMDWSDSTGARSNPHIKVDFDLWQVP